MTDTKSEPQLGNVNLCPVCRPYSTPGRQDQEGGPSIPCYACNREEWVEYALVSARAGKPLAAPSAPTDETGWLIERGGLCLGFCEYKFAWVTFTDDDALRFSRERDAYAFKETIKWPPYNLKLEDATVSEHWWQASAPATAPSAPSDHAPRCPRCREGVTFAVTFHRELEHSLYISCGVCNTYIGNFDTLPVRAKASAPATAPSATQAAAPTPASQVANDVPSSIAENGVAAAEASAPATELERCPSCGSNNPKIRLCERRGTGDPHKAVHDGICAECEAPWHDAPAQRSAATTDLCSCGHPETTHNSGRFGCRECPLTCFAFKVGVVSQADPPPSAGNGGPRDILKDWAIKNNSRTLDIWARVHQLEIIIQTYAEHYAGELRGEKDRQEQILRSTLKFNATLSDRSLAAERERDLLREKLERLSKLTTILLDKLDIALPKVDAIISLNSIRAGVQTYDGLQLGDDIEALREALADLAESQKP